MFISSGPPKNNGNYYRNDKYGLLNIVFKVAHFYLALALGYDRNRIKNRNSGLNLDSGSGYYELDMM